MWLSEASSASQRRHRQRSAIPILDSSLAIQQLQSPFTSADTITANKIFRSCVPWTSKQNRSCPAPLWNPIAPALACRDWCVARPGCSKMVVRCRFFSLVIVPSSSFSVGHIFLLYVEDCTLPVLSPLQRTHSSSGTTQPVVPSRVISDARVT